jgi:transcriptional regulator with PAS, ATPase and Fis domain
MARPRSQLTMLGRLLAGCDQPLVVLDDDRVIVFCNEAFERWTGLSADDLCGQRCDYHSTPEDSDAAAIGTGICPPLEVFAGQRLKGLVAVTPPGEAATERRAEFIPLGDTARQCVGVVVLISTEEATDSDHQAEEPDAQALHAAIRQFRTEQAERYQIDRLIGATPPMVRARSQIETAAGCDANVVIVGPSGSGREHVARAIYYRRHDQPTAPPLGDADYGATLAPLWGSVASAELLRSTVTAVTRRASEQHPGEPGTLLVLDVDQLLAEAQTELAGFLAIDGSRLRVLATARSPLAEAVEQKRFREDLAFKIGTLQIDLPPLAERLDDLPLLAQMFLEQHNAASNRQRSGLTPEALDALAGYPWRGNLDELSEMIAQAHATSKGTMVTLADLPKSIHLAADAAKYPRRLEEPIVLDDVLANLEQELIARAIAQAKGNKTKAAQLLGMTRPRLYRRMVQFGMVDNDDTPNTS